MEIDPRDTPAPAASDAQQENYDIDCSFTPVANGKKNPRAWERKPATPFNPRFKDHKVWKRYELRSKNPDDEPIIRAAERKPSQRAVKRLRKDDGLLGRASHKPYVDVKWDEASESGRRKYARRRSAVKTSPSKSSNPSKTLNLDMGSSPARNGTPTRVRSPVKRIVPPRLFSPTTGSSPARNGTPARHTSPAKDVDQPTMNSPLKAWSPSKRKTPGKKIASSRLSPIKAMALSNASNSMFGLIPFRRPSPERELPSSPAGTSDVSTSDESLSCNPTPRIVKVLFSPPTEEVPRSTAMPQSPTHSPRSTSTNADLDDSRCETQVIDREQGPVLGAANLHLSEIMETTLDESADSQEQDQTSPTPKDQHTHFETQDNIDSINITPSVLDTEGSIGEPNCAQHDDVDLPLPSCSELAPITDCDALDSPSQTSPRRNQIHTLEHLESTIEQISSIHLPLPDAVDHDSVDASPILPGVDVVEALQDEQDSSTLSSIEIELSDDEVNATPCSEPVAQSTSEEHAARLPEERSSPLEDSQDIVPSLVLRTDDDQVLVDANQEEAAILSPVLRTDGNTGLVEGEQDEVTKAPNLTPSITATLSDPRKFSDSLHDDDTALLKSFLSRAQAKKAAAAASNPNQEAFSPPKSTRKTLGEVDNNSVSPQKADPHPELPMKQPTRDMTVTGEAKDLPELSSRRSGRSRTSKPVKAEKDAPSAIPVRRTDGTEHHVILQKSEAQELALTTRANTKRNKGEAKPPKHKMKDLTLAPVEEQATQTKKRVGSKAVSWDETLIYFGQDTIEEEKQEEAPKEEVQPPTRKLRRLGAVNDTPAPKKLAMAPLASPKKVTKEVIGTPGPKRRGRSRG